MKTNRLVIRINKSALDIFNFVITPPNSVLWISNIVAEETDEWPVKKGTIYKLKDKTGEYFSISVINIETNKLVEWVSKDNNYHCRYTFRIIDKNITELEYFEWVDRGNIEQPFSLKTLQRLKFVLEN